MTDGRRRDAAILLQSGRGRTKKEHEEKDLTRVDGVPETAHGDLPRRPTR